MKTTGEKIRDQRIAKDMTQQNLAEAVGVSTRAIINYEVKGTIPRGRNMCKLSNVLGVSVEYLINPEIEDPCYGVEEAPYVEAVRECYGNKGATDMQQLLEANKAMFAGGDIPQEDKDKFFEAVMQAYVITKQEAKETFTPKKFRK